MLSPFAQRLSYRLLAVLGWLVVFGIPAAGQSSTSSAAVEQELERDTDWRPLTPEQLMTRLEAWAANGNLSDRQRAQVSETLASQEAWTQTIQQAKLDALTGLFADVRPEWQLIRKRLQQTHDSPLPINLTDQINTQVLTQLETDHLKLLTGRWLVQHKFYDEALAELTELETESMLVPEALLFYRGLAEHQLLLKAECLQSMRSLLAHEPELPRRFAVVGRMMLSDLEPLETDSLDEISRLMSDIRRRTNFQRSGKIVIDQEQAVIAKLDKLIEQLEAQQQAQQQSSPGSSPGGQPMQDSRQAGDKGDGKVANKDLPDGGQWGDLPPAQRAAALAELTRDLPPHYRAAIEEYFRKLATEADK